MTNRSDIEQALDRYLAEGREQVSDRVVDAALERIDHTSQRHALRVPWRFPDMPYYLRSVMVGAAVVAVLIVGGVLLTRGPTTNVGGPPTTTPSLSTPASAARSATPGCFLTTDCAPSSAVPIDTDDWVSFTSERYGYTTAHPPTWIATSATRAWPSPSTHQLPGCCDFEGSDQFADPNPATTQNSSSNPQAPGVYPIHLTAFAVDVPAGTSEDGWMADYYAGRPWMAPGFCLYASAERRPVSVDGQRGTMVVGDTDCGDAAFVFVDGRVHVFEVEAYDRPALMPEWRTLKTDLLEAFLSTVEFRP